MNNENNKKEFTYLTSRLTVYFLTSYPQNLCTISLDRITISGIFHAEQYFTKLNQNDWKQLSELDGRPTKFELNYINKNGKSNRIAILARNEHQSNSWRIDTSNHLLPTEKKKISNIIKYFDNPHTTRIDIAFDFINWEYAGMLHRLYKTNASQGIFKDRIGNIKTIYCGKNNSRKQYRYYDKASEQRSKGVKVPNGIHNWERLELVTRGNYTNNWEKEAEIMLKSFKLPNLKKIGDKNTKQFLILTGLIEYPEYFNKLSKNTQTKYRKMIKENIGFDTSLSTKGLEVLHRNRNRINQEINSFLGKQ